MWMSLPSGVMWSYRTMSREFPSSMNRDEQTVPRSHAPRSGAVTGGAKRSGVSVGQYTSIRSPARSISALCAGAAFRFAHAERSLAHVRRPRRAHPAEHIEKNQIKLLDAMKPALLTLDNNVYICKFGSRLARSAAHPKSIHQTWCMKLRESASV
jgi:hypothetical protein